MTNFFNVFLLNFVILSGWSQLEAVSLNPSTLDKLNFEIEDSEFNEFENLPQPVRRYAEPPRGRLTKARRNYLERLNDPFTELSSWDVDCQRVQSNSGGVHTVRDLEDSVNVGPPAGASEWQYAPVDVSSVTAKMKKWNLVESPYLRGNADSYRRSARYLDYTNSQMPFNEGKFLRKSVQPKNPEKGKKSGTATPKGVKVAEKSLQTQKSSFDGDEYSEAEPRRKRGGKAMRRRRFFETPRRSRNLEVPRDDPSLEYSRVRRFLDHKRAKKQIRMTSTLEAKEAAMSRVLDPNLNLDGILEPHVRKRRGLHTRKRDLSLTRRHSAHLKRGTNQPTRADDMSAPEAKIIIHSFEY